MFELLLSMQN